MSTTEHEDTSAPISGRGNQEPASGERAEQRYRVLADMLPCQVWTARPDGTLDYVNQRVLDYFQKSVDEILGEGWRNVVHPADLPECGARWGHSLATGDPYDVQFRLRRADGQYRWHQGLARVLRDSRGQIVQWLGTNNDIDDSQKSQQKLEASAAALRDSERRLRLALDAGHLGTWEWDMVAGVVHWSAALERMHGIPEGSFPGTFEAYQRDIHPDDRERVAATIHTNVTTGQDHQLSYRIVRPDGEVRWLEAHGRFDRDPEGHPLRLVGVCGDVTERVRAEIAHTQTLAEEASRRVQQDRQAMMTAHASLRGEVGAALAGTGDIADILRSCCEALTSNLPLTLARIWVLDATQEWLDLRASAGRAAPGGVEPRRLQVGQQRIGIIAAQKRSYRTNTVADDAGVQDHEWARAAGMVAFVGFPLLVGDVPIGVLEGFANLALAEETLIAIQGVSDAIAHGVARRRAELELDERARALARSNAELEQFAYVASHDLQEPLRIVASYTQLLARRYKGRLDQDADEFIAFAVDGVTRMQRLITDLLAYSRVGTRGRPFTQVSTEDVLTLALNNLRQVMADGGGQVRHDPLPEVLGDQGQLMQLFQNLVGNALKFTGTSPPVVEVSARREDQGWLFSVADNGVGIEPQYFERIFVIFQRLHSIDSYPGTGIGLALCKKIVERHGGRIWLESKPNVGSTFFFSLPDGVESER